MNSAPSEVEPATQTLELIADHQLLVERKPAENVIKLVGSGGQVGLTIAVTPAGPVLRLEGAGLMIQTTGALAIDAGHVAIHGREGVAISSGGDATIQVRGDLETEARIQQITAVLGNVNLKANDDVTLDG